MNTIPTKQNAVQLTGPDTLELNTAKTVTRPGPYQILLNIKAVGLCFSDLKLLKQFNTHPRKGPVLSGIDSNALREIPSYQPGLNPTVPGHEAFGEIVAVGDKVTHHKVGEKVLVQADYRWLPTDGSNAAFGYNIEGGLQSYVILDERVIIDPVSGQSCLIPVINDRLSFSSIALVEPWACVESSFLTVERHCVKTGGRLLIVVADDREIKGVKESFAPAGAPAETIVVCSGSDMVHSELSYALKVEKIEALEDESFDDIIYFGHDAAAINILNDKLAPGGIINIVLNGSTIGRDISVGVGRVHYGMTRWIGTVSDNASESYKNIPLSGEIRPGDNALIIGAAGPMGQMHTIRLLSCGVPDISVTGTDFDADRLASLAVKANVLAQRRGVKLELINTRHTSLETGIYSYIDIMAPVGAVVAQAVEDAAPGAVINIFAGIPATVRQDIDLDTYIRNRCFMFGTSGSRVSDMMIVLDKVLTGQLDTDSSVDAVSGIAGAIDGIRAVENRLLSGKIIVYPQLPDMPLTTLTELKEKYPGVYARLDKGIWTKAAEAELLKEI